MSPHTVPVTTRPLTAFEQQALQRLRAAAATPQQLDALLRELVVAREVLRIVRAQRRCLPQHARQALNGLPHARATAVEFSHD